MGSIISTGCLFCSRISIISAGFINKSSKNFYYKSTGFWKKWSSETLIRPVLIIEIREYPKAQDRKGTE